MGRPKRLYPLGKYRLHTPKESDKNKAYPIELEYTWNRQIIHKQQMSLLRKPTGIRTAIKVVEKFVSVMALSINASINCCWHVLSGSTLCLQSIMKSIPIKSGFELRKSIEAIDQVIKSLINNN